MNIVRINSSPAVSRTERNKPGRYGVSWTVHLNHGYLYTDGPFIGLAVGLFYDNTGFIASMPRRRTPGGGV